MMYVVVYDISDSRRRRRLHDQLLNYGTGVQYSVFEIEERCLDGALKATPPAGTFHLAQEPRPLRPAA